MLLPGQRIKSRRLELGIKQTELAVRLGMAQSSLSELENGESVMPNSEHLLKLARILGVSQSWILTGKDGEVEVLDQEEQQHAMNMRTLTAEQKRAIYGMVEAFTSKEDKP
jgi:repressor LexA